MREVAGRYERVHGHLTKWSNELEDFQSDADKLLRQAKEKQEEVEADKAKKPGLLFQRPDRARLGSRLL
ncbi:hypothetical protein [Streptomyces tendae]